MPSPCTLALDIGCGEGWLTPQLSRRAEHVMAIDVDLHSIETARRGDSKSVYIHGNFLEHTFDRNSIDFIVCVAALHHMDAEVALRRMRDILRPGGTLAV